MGPSMYLWPCMEIGHFKPSKRPIGHPHKTTLFYHTIPDGNLRRYGFDSQHPQDDSQQSITSVPGNPALMNDMWYTYMHTCKTCVPSLSLYLELIKMRLSFIWTTKQPSGEPCVLESYIRQYEGHWSMQVSTTAPLVTAYFSAWECLMLNCHKLCPLHYVSQLNSSNRGHQDQGRGKSREQASGNKMIVIWQE